MRPHASSAALAASRAIPRPVARSMRRVLNVGSGHQRVGRLHRGFDPAAWAEIRLDIDPAVKPDLIGSVLDMGDLVPAQSVDAVWCSHILEHLDGHDVVPALTACHRALKADGFALVTSPDLAAIARRILSDGLETAAYVSPAGPIAALDMLFGHGASLEAGKSYMAHRTGFTADRLGRLATAAGFPEARVACGDSYDLWALLLMPRTDLVGLQAAFAGTPLARILF